MSILSKGTYKGYDWIVSRSGQNRCGYVIIPKGHIFYGTHYLILNSLGVKVHGGLTYSKEEEIDGKEKWMIGFDCGHPGDAPDPSLPDDLPTEIKKFRDILNFGLGIIENNPNLLSKGVIRTQEFVENELKKLIDQIITLSMRGS